MNNNFDQIHENSLDGWGFSFRRSQLYRFEKYISILKKYSIGGHILEIGCSTGFFTDSYLRDLKNIKLKAIDISEVAIKKAKQNHPNMDFEVGSLPDTNYKTSSFDLVTAIEFLYYMSDEDQKKSIDEIYRILCDNGYILVSVNIGDKPYYTVEEIRKLIEKRFDIAEEDGLYIKSYYKYIEVRLWSILELFSSYDKFVRKSNDGIFKSTIKILLNIFAKNKFVYLTYGFVIRNFAKFLLYVMPIRMINYVSKKISKNEQSIYIALAKKRPV